MRYNYINMLLGLIWLAIFILAFIPQTWSNYTIKGVSALFAFIYFKGWFDGRKL